MPLDAAYLEAVRDASHYAIDEARKAVEQSRKLRADAQRLREGPTPPFANPS